MSSVRPNDDRSPEGAGAEHELASLLRLRGGPLVEALELHLPGAAAHAEATASYAFVAAVGLGLERARAEIAREAAMLHEVGLIYVPAEVAEKPAPERDEAEARTWAEHYEAGYRLARGAGVPEHVCGWILRARERFDGAGPEQLDGEQIPIESRLMRAACACHYALTRTDPGEMLARRRAIEQLNIAAGAELDPHAVVALVAVIEHASPPND